MSEIRTDTINNASGDNDSGIDLSTNDQVVIKTADTTAVTVDSSQNTTFAGNITSTGTTTTGTASITADGTNGIALRRNTNVGLGVSMNNAGTDIGGLYHTTGNGLGIAGKNDNSGGLIFGNGANPLYPAKVTSGAIATVDDYVDLGSPSLRFEDLYATTGSIQTSDQQEKNTIEDSDLGLDFIKRLSPKSFIFNGKTRTHYGLIAQDVENVLSDINKTTTEFAGFIKSDISEEEDGSQYRYGLRYTEFVAPLIKAIKEQQTIIENLQARITALESE